MPRLPIAQLLGILVGASIVLGLLVARGFNLAEHARIMLGALALIWLTGGAWALATAAEGAGGWKALGARALLVVLASFVAGFAPAAVLWLLTR